MCASSKQTEAKAPITSFLTTPDGSVSSEISSLSTLRQKKVSAASHFIVEPTTCQSQRIFMKENQSWHIFYRLVSQTSCSILKCLVSVQVLGCTVCFKLINRTWDIITCNHWKHLPFHTYSRSISRTHISWKVLKIALRGLQIWKFSGGGYHQSPVQGFHEPWALAIMPPASRYKKPSYGPECFSILGSGHLKTTVNFNWCYI